MASPPEDQPSPPPCSFPSTFRLKRQRLIRPLFDRRRKDVGSVAVGCVRLLFRTVPRIETGHDVPLQIGFVPGRRARSSVTRNCIKRYLREVYRVRQHILVDLFQHRTDSLIVMVLFRGAPDEARACIRRDLSRALDRLAERVANERPA